VSTHRVLALALAVQVVFVAVAWWPQDSSGGRGPVIDVERDAIDRIEISLRPTGDAEPDPAVLVRAGEGWTVHSAADYPAAVDKVEELLDKLLALRTGMPIATRAASHEALKVASDGYGRRIEIVAGGESQAWLVGAATSKSVNLRREGEDDVYRAVGSGEWSFRDGDASYYDASYVAADPASFEALVVRNDEGEIRFEQVEGRWQLADLAEGEQSDAEKISGFVDKLVSLRMTQPAARETTPEHGLGDSAVRVDWTIAAEDQSSFGGYAVGADVEGDRFVKAVDSTFVVRVRETAVESLLSADRSEFLLTEG
jgi:hypothetical protein